jgi:hypothetical protein
MTTRLLTLLALLGVLASASPALAGQKVTTPLLRVADPEGTAHGSVQAKLKGPGSSLTIKVIALDAGTPTPLGMFLEDAPASGDFTKVAGLATLKNGAGKITLASGDGAPGELGVASLDDLAGRRLEVRDANGAALLDAVLPGLQPFVGTKLVGKLLPPDGAPAPKASATLTGKAKPSKGSERFRLKAKKLPAGAAAALFIEDAPGSGIFLPAGELDGSVYLRDTALGDRLPLEVAAQADLVGRAIQVRDGDTVLLVGTIEQKGPPGLTFPMTGVIIIPGGTLEDDRYLRVVGLDGPLYRTITDISQVTPAQLAAGGEALWRIDKIGDSPDGPVVTVTLQGHDDTWWMSSVIGAEHYVRVNKQMVDPATKDYAHWILHILSDGKGKPSIEIESQYFPGEFLENKGHSLTANGVALGPAVAIMVLYPVP